MQMQSVQEPLPHLLRHHRTVPEVFHGLHPVFSPDSGLDGPPGGFDRPRIYGIFLQPGCQLSHKTRGVLLISGQSVSLAQTDPVPVAVELVDKFRIALGHILPVNVPRKLHGLRGLLHIPGQVEQKALFYRIVCNPQDVGALLRPEFPAIPGAPLHIDLLHLHLCPPLYQPFTPPAVIPSTNHFWHTINTISTGIREQTEAAMIRA